MARVQKITATLISRGDAWRVLYGGVGGWLALGGDLESGTADRAGLVFHFVCVLLPFFSLSSVARGPELTPTVFFLKEHFLIRRPVSKLVCSSVVRAAI